MIRSAMIFALLFSFASASWADERTQKTIEARQGLLKVVAQYFGPIVGMAKGQIPFDAALIEKNAGKVAELAPMITDLYAQDTSASDYATEAKADIWADYEDYSAKAATTTERANARCRNGRRSWRDHESLWRLALPAKAATTAIAKKNNRSQCSQTSAPN